MKLLDLVNKKQSNIDYFIFKFPDGEVQITLGEFSHKEEIMILCRITNAEELFILMQVCDILKRHGVCFGIHIFYLMSMRMDRVMDFNRPFSLSIVCNVLDNLGARYIAVYCPHSLEIKRLIKNSEVMELSSILRTNFEKYQLVFPDEGARIRYADVPIGKHIFGKKTRDLATGKITSIEIENPEDIDGRPLLIRDDLCDGGGTFIGLAEAIRKINPNLELNILVDHMVNPKGIENLSKTFNHVWFTNSYKDWKSLPENVTMINIA